jgi:hypothetical protein
MAVKIRPIIAIENIISYSIIVCQDPIHILIGVLQHSEGRSSRAHFITRKRDHSDRLKTEAFPDIDSQVDQQKQLDSFKVDSHPSPYL